MSGDRQTHERLVSAEQIHGSSNRSFGVVIGIAVTVIGLLPLIDGNGPRGWLLLIGGVLLVIAAVAPDLLTPFNRLWTRFGLVLHQVASTLVLGLLFYLVFTPIGLLLHAFNKDPLRRRLNPDTRSYWIERRPPGPSPDSLKHQF